MATTFESRTLGIGIDRPFDAVHDFLSAPENFPKWAAGLGQSIRKADGDWIAETPHGPVRVRFTDRNPLGEIGRAHVCTPVPNAQLVFRLLRDTNKQISLTSVTSLQSASPS